MHSGISDRGCTRGSSNTTILKYSIKSKSATFTILKEGFGGMICPFELINAMLEILYYNHESCFI